MWKWLFRFFIFLFFLIILLSIFLWTPFGSRFLVEKIASHYHIELSDVKGNLIEGFDVGQLTYIAPINSTQSASTLKKISARQLSFRWQPMGLLYATIKLQRVSADELSIQWSTSADNTPEKNWPSFAQPFLIELNQIKLGKLVLQHNEDNYRLNNLQGAVTLGAFNLQLNAVSADLLATKLNVDGKIATHFPYAFSLKGKYKINSEVWKLENNYSLMGDLTQFKLETLVKPLESVEHNTDHLAKSDYLKIIANISTGISNKDNQLVALLKRPLNKTATEKLNENSLRAYLEVSFFSQKPETIFHSPVLHEFTHLESSAHASITVNQPLSQLTHLNIELSDWQTSVEALGEPVALAITGAVPLSWNTKGLLNAELNIGSATIGQDAPEKYATQKALLELKNKLGVSGAVQMRLQLPVDAALFSLEELAANLKLNGALMKQPLDFGVNFNWNAGAFTRANLKGRWGTNELKINGDVKKQQWDWDFTLPDLKIFQPWLSEVVEGEIKSQGSFSGDFKHPRIAINASAKNIAWQTIALETMDLSIKPVKGLDHQLALQAKALSGFGYQVNGFSLKSEGTLEQHHLLFAAQLNAKQSNAMPTNHLLDGISGNIEGEVIAGLKKGSAHQWSDLNWQGRWKSLTVKMNELPAWRLAQAQGFKLNRSTVNIADLCLVLTRSDAGNNAAPVFEPSNYSAVNKQLLAKHFSMSVMSQHQETNLCINANANLVATPKQNLWEAQLDLTGLPAEFFNAWLKTDTHLVGYSDGHLEVSQKPKAFLKAKLNAQSRGLALVYQFQDQAAEIYPVSEANFNAELNNQVLQFQSRWDLGTYGYVNGTGSYQLPTQKIQTKWDAQLNSLAPFEAVVPLLNNLEGKAALDLSVNGTLENPRLSGNFLIENATAKIPSLGLILKNMQLRANSLVDESIHLDARATSGEGTLVVNGSLENLGQKNWRWDSNIFGANIRAIENPLLSATINPNLRLQATAANIALTGSMEIPWARAVMKTLPASATRLSKDVVLVNSKTVLNSNSYAQSLGKKINAQTHFFAMPFTSNLLVYFGDDVRFKGFGLDSQLIGKVNVLKEKNRQVFTTGFVGVGTGNYKAYGQELKIERGRLIFQGPYDNPGLDIRALRELENGSAGLEIGGTLQQPKSSVFSVPASTPSEAMALLVTGKPLAQSSQADAYALLGAISHLGMDDGDSMTTDIAHLFSLDELGVKADKGLEQSSLWVGKYVTPKLFIRYVVGLFDQAFSVGMRYQLNEKFRLEAESGKTQSIDVIYKIER